MVSWNNEIKDFVKEKLSTTFNDEYYKICRQEPLVTHKLYKLKKIEEIALIPTPPQSVLLPILSPMKGILLTFLAHNIV